MNIRFGACGLAPLLWLSRAAGANTLSAAVSRQRTKLQAGKALASVLRERGTSFVENAG